MLPDLEWEYGQWEQTHTRSVAGGTLFFQADVQDAMEETISGGRKKKYLRPSINSYMYGNAMAIANIATLCGDDQKAETYRRKAADISDMAHRLLWNEQQQFFETHRVDSSANVREAIGYLPWYTGMARDEAKYAVAWQQLNDEKGFAAPYGLTTAERRHPQFRSHGVGKCEWDGAVWPFATSQTLTALANFISNYPAGMASLAETDLTATFFREMQKYMQSQSMRGKPYIGEYLDETTGCWLKGDQERSRYYNHSTFCDLVITGLCGLRPRADGTLEVRPLVPANEWKYFCLDNVLYHGHNISIVWDRDGSRYHAGSGLSVYVDGTLVARRADIGPLICEKAL